MQRSEFTKNASGEVIKTRQGYWAFVPKALPPRIHWTDTLMGISSKADRSLARLAEVGNAFPAPHAVAQPFMRKEAVYSSQIEGTHTSLQQLFSYEAGQLSLFRDMQNAHEVQNYVKAIDFGLERLKNLPLSMRLIREMHTVLMQGVRGESMAPGEVRQSQNWIGRAGATIETARYAPPPVEEMQICLADLEKYMHAKSELPPLLRIGMIHYQFEAIHPFLDGNGRLGRLLVTLLLVAWGLLFQPLLSLSSFIEERRQEYYERLLAVSQRGEWEEWLRFFLQGVHQQAEDTSRRILYLQTLRKQYHTMLAGESKRANLEKVVDYLISTPITSIKQAQESLQLGSFTTIERYFEKMVKLGILKETTGRARKRIYRSDAILRALEEEIVES